MSRGTQGICWEAIRFCLQDYHLLWWDFPDPSTNELLCNSPALHRADPTTPPVIANRRFGLFPVRSPLLRESIAFSFPQGTEMFHFPWFAPHPLCIQGRVFQVYWNRLPHSEIPGSKPVSGSPRLIAACHVLHRLLMPRHPPYALSSLTINLPLIN